MEDIFINETIPADYMKAVAKRAYIYDFSIINTESERHFIDSLIQHKFLIKIEEVH